ncbi:MAG TPA: rhodanese-like domain-containing protein, partial [Candidatus Eisenbacteria bacterium]
MKGIRGAALVAVAALALAGCSDSSTDSKDVGPYPNSDLLVSGASLATNLAAPGQIIVDTRSATAYAAGHIPGAINIPITPGNGTFDKGGSGPDATDLKPPAELAAALGAAGIRESNHVVVCGTDIDWLAGRLFWMLEYLGAPKVSMLDGGFSKWAADGRTTSTAATTLPPATFTPHVVATRLVDKTDVLAHY